MFPLTVCLTFDRQITVERRLYDIGSILCSVGLLERIYMKKR